METDCDSVRRAKPLLGTFVEITASGARKTDLNAGIDAAMDFLNTSRLRVMSRVTLGQPLPYAHVARIASFGPEEPKLLEGYKPNAPVITFQNEMKLHVGNHTFRLVHMPGHTAYQAAVIVEEEGVVFTSDNIFCKVHTWLQEADPTLWLEALESLRRLREDTFVPGHGPICDKRYLDEQGAFIREWVDYVRKGAGQGMTKEQCVADLTAMTDRYPMDVGQDGMAPNVMKMNVANLYDFVTGAGIHRRN